MLPQRTRRRAALLDREVAPEFSLSAVRAHRN